MKNRRAFLKIGAGAAATGLGLIFSPLLSGIRWAFAETQKILLPKGTEMDSLIQKNPAHLDPRNLEVIPLKDFGTMGLSDHAVNTPEWRLDVGGAVKEPFRLTYEDVKVIPRIERKVLLICPGFFANYGRWQGISMPDLLQRAGVDKGVSHVRFSGPEGPYQKVAQYPIQAVRTNQVFLAYGVNGKRLPTKHGFPLRLVAEGYYGYDWVKYVDKVELIRNT